MPYSEKITIYYFSGIPAFYYHGLKAKIQTVYQQNGRLAFRTCFPHTTSTVFLYFSKLFSFVPPIFI
ncbi:MAG TPA: hypothetical protein DDZ96_09480 [Porphyromonadaceae bacterium]|nr:hypothetical protein [Porphyromonadaceae bacterium]HBK30347.1 hypothetical protein [Porphyromonadaceae bacterium]HBL34028.1 hypothetical protein [Porphyromonadaceae bacterium]HBX45150.1 hypothetical protein [Porphyromonadaceae bacterium]